MKRLLTFMKPYIPQIILSLIFSCGSVASAVLLPVMSGKGIDHIIGPGKVDLEKLGTVALMMVIILVVGALCQWLMGMVNNKISYAVTRDLRKQAFEKLMTIPISDIDSHPHGDYVSRIVTDADTVSDGLLLGFSQLFSGILTILGTLVMMVSMNGAIALIVILLTPISIVVARLISGKTFKYFTRMSQDRGDMTDMVSESISQAALVRQLGYTDPTREKFDAVNKKLTDSSIKAVFASSITNPGTRFVNSLIYVAVCVSGAFLVIAGGMSVGELSAFLGFAREYTKPFNEITGVITEFTGALASAKRIFEIIDAESEQDGTAEAPENGCDALTFDNVRFGYTPDKILIEDLSLKADRGERVAIVGPTGAGKTTLINLIMRFYDVCSGSIAMDGKDIRDTKRSSLRSEIGMVLQESWLFTGTIRENLMMAAPEATEEEMIEAAKAAHAHSFIKKLPQGYDTMIGAGSAHLSQGQVQLLCIARLMLALPPMLILDEATSSIDTRTELKIQDAFAVMMQGRTTFIVAHRLRTIMSADLILYMENGHVLEQGTHAQLLAQDGKYAELYRSQFM